LGERGVKNLYHAVFVLLPVLSGIAVGDAIA
jgi:hypothetical protein